MRKVILGLLTLFVLNICYGQVNFGVKTGINIATTKNLIAFPQNRVGWYGGISSDIILLDNFFLQPEVIYSSKGEKSSDNQGGTSTTVKRLNYINLSVLIGYHFDKKTSIVLGPELGYLVAARFLISNNNLNVIRQYPPKFDMGASVGIHYKISKNIEPEIRYIYGFNRLYSVDALGNRYSEKKAANRVFQIGLHYIIDP